MNKLNGVVHKKEIIMKQIVKALTGLFLFGMVGVADAAFVTVGDGFGSDPVQLDFVSWDPNFVLEPNYRITKINWKITNTTANTYGDVRFVLPFLEFGSSSGSAAYDWDNTNQIWHSSVDDGFDALNDGISAWASDSVGSILTSFVLMSDTDIALSSGPSSVLTTDSVPYWSIDATLNPAEVVAFTTYIRQERSASVGGIWVTPFVVAVPVPAAAWLFGSALGLLGWIRRRTA